VLNGSHCCTLTLILAQIEAGASGRSCKRDVFWVIEFLVAMDNNRLRQGFGPARNEIWKNVFDDPIVVRKFLLIGLWTIFLRQQVLFDLAS
jgi:hypothetical protein